MEPRAHLSFFVSREFPVNVWVTADTFVGFDVVRPDGIQVNYGEDADYYVLLVDGMRIPLARVGSVSREVAFGAVCAVYDAVVSLRPRESFTLEVRGEPVEFDGPIGEYEDMMLYISDCGPCSGYVERILGVEYFSNYPHLRAESCIADHIGYDPMCDGVLFFFGPGESWWCEGVRVSE